MIAVDTSTWIGFLQGDGGEDADLLDRALEGRQVLMVPIVLTEVLSDPKLPAEVSQTLLQLPLIEVEPGYWQRAGELRAKVLAKGRKARLGDALIAQSCVDRGIPLLTRDGVSGPSPQPPGSISSFANRPPALSQLCFESSYIEDEAVDAPVARQPTLSRTRSALARLERIQVCDSCV